VVTITEKLNKRRIVLIALLKSKGINNNELFAKILIGNKKTLNLIHRKHILRLRTRSKDEYKPSMDQLFFKHIIKDKYFRKNILLVDKTDIIRREINKILRNRHTNNKNNTIFQDLIDSILDLLLSSNNTHLSVDLYFFVKNNYKVYREINIINEVRKAGKYTLNKLKLVNEFIDHIDYFNFLNNDIDKFQKLRMKKVVVNYSDYKLILLRLQKLNECFLTNPFKLVKTHQKHTSILNKGFVKLWHINDKTFNLGEYIVDFFNLIESFVNSDKDLKEIYNQLTLNKGKIQTKLLYNQLTKLKTDLHKTLYEINYSIDYSNEDQIAEYGNIYYKGVLPFHESGQLELSDKEYTKLNINALYFKKSNVKSIRNLKNGYFNKRKIDGQIKIISEGVNPYNRNKHKKSYYIIYQYITTQDQQIQFKRLMKLFYLPFKKYYYPKGISDFKDYVDCTYTYPYMNKQQNYKAFKEYYKEITQSSFSVKFSHIYPYATTSTRMKNKFLNFTSIGNNIWREYFLRKHIDRNLANIFYRLDLDRKITNFYNPKNQLLLTKRKQRLFLVKIIKGISMNKQLTKLFNEFLNKLIKDFDNRIYLFQSYGLNALDKQILHLQQFYDSFKAKRNLKVIRCKHLIKRLKTTIPLRKQYLSFLEMQRSTIINYQSNFKPYNVLIQSILNDNIEKYLYKSLIRKIQINRSKVECILMACNNLNSLHIKYLDSMPVYVKEIDQEINKFDEILDSNDNYKIEYVDQWKSIDIIHFFKCIIKFDKYLNLDDLYDTILNVKINEKEILKDYIYKEKSILNQF